MGITGSDTNLHEERLEFTLLRVDIGVADDCTVHPPGAEIFSSGSSFIRDSISFCVGGQEWKLRRLVAYGDEFLPADTAYHRAEKERVQYTCNPRVKHAMLEVPIGGISQEDAEETADNIGWLLGLAFGQRVAWNQVGIRKNHIRRTIKARSISLPEEASVKQPIRNQGEHEIRMFLEAAYPVFLQDPEWWKITLHWFSLACEITTVEVSGMIHSMLLDRISSRVLDGHSFGKLIGEDLGECLTDPSRRKKLVEDLTGVMQQPAESWTDELSGKLIQKISEWNNTPSYPKKIATVYEIVGLLPPPKMVIDARHTLMHVGSLPKAVKKEISAYHRDIHQSIVVLLLRMLRYEGSFFVPDRGICSMRDFVALAENSLDILKQEFPQADHPTPR